MSMTNIRNDEELKTTWIFFHMYEKIAKTDEQIEYLKEMKKSIRRYYADKKSEAEHRYFDCNSDGYRIFVETSYVSVESAYENHIHLTCYPDQIGRWYESSCKFFRRSDGKVCAYVHYLMNW